ncbi:hypothetical protein RGQ29_006408 [Quercus rubra]|uniref:Alpha 1,4-glycosyltransferase domain-containing protein n=1 Tax=Quercus rubra TaxID=3512 RepID=A0AAN7E783_QUERU|nr:hypothetical protein RGQ29_006408 [Quercus rubra]
MQRTRRRGRNGAQLCAVISAFLLLFLSVSLLYSRLSHSHSPNRRYHYQNDVDSNPLLEDNSDVVSSDDNNNVDDKIDILDEDQQQQRQAVLEEGEEEEEEGEEEQQQNDESFTSRNLPRDSGYYFDHVTGAIRKSFKKKKTTTTSWDEDDLVVEGEDRFLGFMMGSTTVVDDDDRSKSAFASDDVPLDETVRRKAANVAVEEALLLKTTGRFKASPLREVWGDWFEKKSDFLRRDKMFKSNFETLNPLNNPMLQDPDGVGVTTFTRGDRLVQKWWLNEFKRVPFLTKRPLSVSETGKRSKPGFNANANGRDLRNVDNGLNSKRIVGTKDGVVSGIVGNVDNGLNRNDGVLSLSDEGDRLLNVELDKNVGNVLNSRGIVDKNDGVLGLSDKSKSKRAEDRSLVEDVGNGLNRNRVADSNDRLNAELGRNGGGLVDVDKGDIVGGKTEFSGHIYANGKRWGYYPGVHPHLSFSDFMDAFFRKGKCDVRVFMVWNSPPWMYSVRHQRGLESLLSQHRDACVVVFSETIELDFFKDSFVKDGYKIAVAMPNLDELLEDTPTHVFASVWFEWKKTKFYPTHYSELVRLAALYKYGGIYLDSDIIVLRPLSLLNNSVGMEDHLAGSSLNGAVMAFRKQSPFIMECLKEFYMTYDDTQLRWNGADLLTRVSRKFWSQEKLSIKQLELNVQDSFIFFPISSQNISRYFTAPATETEKARQDDLFRKMLDKSLTFHFWNSLTSALIPEPESLVNRLIDHTCIRCFDVL